MPAATRSSEKEVRRLLVSADEAKARVAAYNAVERLARSEATVAKARMQHMTPLPKLPKDKDTIARLKSVRSRYDSIVKSGKAIAAACEHRIKDLTSQASKAHKKASDERRKSAAKTANATKTKTTSKKKSTSRK